MESEREREREPIYEKKRRARVIVTPELIHNILVDKYHNNMDINEIKKKYKISYNIFKEIHDTFAHEFLVQFGKKEKIIKIADIDMRSFWAEKKEKEEASFTEGIFGVGKKKYNI